ncbi:type I methionyl aminopeptidase [Haloimpatiens lingqiaonensis]|uniref:type I methionyl aminopeptidase n=1 Tax=Haloimpatiens lingqiaonensis TaxID=1380675 RepID=UPI0010FDB1D6|nr:type I methionyl aminopeptidase [Haloimpatiens lingqiaonensis]
MKKEFWNKLCWCGSGKKYKDCHLDLDMRLEALAAEGHIVPDRDMIKTDLEIEGIRKSGRLTKAILDMVGEKIKEGVTTEEVNNWVHQFTVEHGGIPAPLNYMGYPKSVCISINEVVCHGIPNEETVLKNGDIVNVDVTTILDGYYSDSSRMYIIGEGSEEAKRLVKVAKECLYEGIKEVKPFATLGDIGYSVQKHAEKNGYSVIRDYGGHGIGLDFHEDPFVAHCGERGRDMVLFPGMVFTIEPMINQGTYEYDVLKDGWTVLTKDRKLSAQWEHTVLVTREGYEILT